MRLARDARTGRNPNQRPHSVTPDLNPGWHFAFEFAAYFVAARVFWRTRLATPQPPQRDRFVLLACAVFGAALGSKGLHVLEHLPVLRELGYALRTATGIMPLTRFIGPDVLLAGERNTIVFEQDPVLKGEVFRLFATNLSPEMQATSLSSLLCCLPNVQAPPNVGYDSVFRVLIMAFMDATAFDVRAMKKSCVHIVQTDGRIIPFESFNLLYRDDRRAVLEERRAEVETLYGIQRSLT